MRIVFVPCLLLHAAAAFCVDDTATPMPATDRGETASGTDRSMHSWEMPALNIQGKAPTGMRDADLVGAYGQPRWSTIRRFSEVRTYVIPKGQVEFEYWLFISTPSKHELDDAKANGQPRPKSQIKQQYEGEFGLGHRFQLDLYQVYVKDGSDGNNQLDSTKFELRYALADWGKIWANPTLYGEWTQAASGPDLAEFKLLLCDGITDRLMWATNFVCEQATGGTRDRSLEWNTAVAYDAMEGLSGVSRPTSRRSQHSPLLARATAPDITSTPPALRYASIPSPKPTSSSASF